MKKKKMKYLKFMKLMAKQGYGFFMKGWTGTTGQSMEYDKAELNIVLTHKDLPTIYSSLKCSNDEALEIKKLCKKHSRKHVDDLNCCKVNLH